MAEMNVSRSPASTPRQIERQPPVEQVQQTPQSKQMQDATEVPSLRDGSRPTAQQADAYRELHALSVNPAQQLNPADPSVKDATGVKRGLDPSTDPAQSAQGSSSPIGTLVNQMKEMMAKSPELAQAWGPYLQTLQGLDKGGASATDPSQVSPTDPSRICPNDPSLVSPTQAQPSQYTPTDGSFSTEAQVGQLTPADGQKMAVQIANQLMSDFGLSKEQAAGVAGNLMHESAGMNSNVNEFGSGGEPFGAPNSSQFGYGWAQWTGDRKDAFLSFAQEQGLDPSSPAANYAMLKNELSGAESGTLSSLQNASTPADAAVAFRSVFERAASPVDEKRMAAAEEVYAAMD